MLRYLKGTELKLYFKTPLDILLSRNALNIGRKKFQVYYARHSEFSKDRIPTIPFLDYGGITFVLSHIECRVPVNYSRFSR